MSKFTDREQVTLYGEALLSLSVLNLLLLGGQFIFFPRAWAWILIFQFLVHAILLWVLIWKLKIKPTKAWWDLLNRK